MAALSIFILADVFALVPNEVINVSVVLSIENDRQQYKSANTAEINKRISGYDLKIYIVNVFLPENVEDLHSILRRQRFH